MNAALHEVKLADGYSSATAARATGTAVISYQDLTRPPATASSSSTAATAR